MTRIAIVGGHYGVGKSEFTIALARAMRSEDERTPITVIDLDVVNPYFRTREARATLEPFGIDVIGNSLGVDTGVDVPAIPRSVIPALRDTGARTIIDLGGDPAGARALRQFRPHIPPEDTTVLFLVNAFRPEVSSLATARASLAAIENELGLSCGGLVNNTHLLHETDCTHLQRGDRLCHEISVATGIPVVFHAATRSILERCGDRLAGRPITILEALRQQWMKQGNEHTPERPAPAAGSQARTEGESEGG
jgi:hypothetical protein